MASGIVESQSGSEQQPQQGGSSQGQQVARQRLVQRLLAASANLPNFLHELILTQAHVVAGTEAAAFIIEPGQQQAEGAPAGPAFSLKLMAHIRPDGSDAETRAAAIQAFQDIVRPCVEQNKDGAIHIDGTDDGSESQYCLVTLLRAEGNAVAVSAVITRSRDDDRAKQRVELMSIVGGYFELFTLRRAGEQARTIAQSHQHVLQLSTAVATAEGFDSSAMNLCNELASRAGAARVSIGWVKGNTIKLKAISHSEQFDKKQELSVQLVKVMEECWDNDEIVQYEPNGTSTSTVTREAASLSRTQGGETVLSLPLRRKGEVVGVLTLEFAPNTQLGQQVAQGMAVAVDLLAPQLYDRYQNDRYLVTKAGLSIQEIGKKTIGPKHMLAKTVVTLVIAGLLFITLYKPMYRVTAPFQFTPIEKRTFSAPYDGAMLWKVNFKPGEPVKEGEVVLEFESFEAQKQLARAMADLSKAVTAVTKYRAEGKTAEMTQALAEQDAAQAEIDLYQWQIDNAQVRAPWDGIILTGDLKDKEKATFKQGDPLMEMAKKESLKAELSVAERDIQDVHEGSVGYLATTAQPNDRKPFKIERIVPAGVPKEGGNVFTVYATLMESSGQWHPGMQGEARVDVKNRRLVWIWTHRFVEFVRLKLWI